jgi:hypothetical protein
MSLRFLPRPRVALAIATLSLAMLNACGYGLMGRGGLDPSIKRIGVPIFRDATGRTSLDQKITQKVIEELLKRGKVDVVPKIEGVDAVVDGEIVSYQVTPVGFAGTGGATTARRYAITLTAKVRYYKPGQPEPIWQNDSFSFRDEYDLDSDPSSFFDREDQSVDRLAQAFARSLVAAMLEAF